MGKEIKLQIILFPNLFRFNNLSQGTYVNNGSDM